MRERDVVSQFMKAQVDGWLAVILFGLDLVGAWAIIQFVIHEPGEQMAVGGLLILVLASQYLVYRKLAQKLAESEQSKPNICVSQIRQAPMHGQWVMSGSESQYRYDVLQVWFENDPPNPCAGSIAKDLTAKVSLFKADQPVFSYHGQWANSNAPDNVGYDGFFEKVDFPPGYLEAKLFIALKHKTDRNCYAFTREGLRECPDGRSPRYFIAEGCYKVTINLKGVGVDKVFSFEFTNSGFNQPMKLDQI